MTRVRPFRIFALTLSAVTAAILAAPPQALAEDAPEKHPSDLFLKHCAECHGVDGKAQTEDGRRLKAEVFAAPGWVEKKRSKADKLVVSVLNGHGKKMPAFKDKLTPEQAKQLVEKDVLGDWK